MSSEKKKFAKLVRGLSKKTHAGTLNWTESPDENEFVCSVGSSSIALEHIPRNQTGTADELFVVSVYNEDGVLMDKFNDEEIVGEYGNVYEDTSYEAMKDIYNTARRRALGAEQLLDSILDEFKDELAEDEIPF